MMLNRNSTPISDRRAGFSLVEVVICTFLVGTIVVASMRALGASVRANEMTNHRGRAILLADGLISEIQRKDYVDSNGAVFGRETGEMVADRSQHDDVDDYDGWSASPPEHSDGTQIVGLAGWQRSVDVEHVDAEDLSTVLSDTQDDGVKRVRVTVQRNNEILAELDAIVTGTSIEIVSPF